jgi:hypothetical protein
LYRLLSVRTPAVLVRSAGPATTFDCHQVSVAESIPPSVPVSPIRTGRERGSFAPGAAAQMYASNCSSNPRRSWLNLVWRRLMNAAEPLFFRISSPEMVTVPTMFRHSNTA